MIARPTPQHGEGRRRDHADGCERKRDTFDSQPVRPRTGQPIENLIANEDHREAITDAVLADHRCDHREHEGPADQ